MRVITLATTCYGIVAGIVLSASLATAQEWTPPVPGEDTWDWIQMNSGEWFKGEVKSLRDGALEFDSDELDILNLDWADVASMRMPHVSTYRVDKVGVFIGTAIVQGGQLSIRALDGQTHTFPQDRLLLIVAGAGRELDFWTVRASFGLVARSGNTDQSDFNTNTRIQRRTPRSRLLLTYLGNIGQVEDQTNIENHNLNGSLDMVIRSGFYVTPVSANYFRDRFQNISSKTTIAIGLGYEIVNSSKVEWDINFSTGYQYNKFESVQPGEPESEENLSLIPATTFSYDITSDIEMDFDYNAQVGVPDANRAFHHANLVVSIDLYGSLLDLDLSLTWDRTESPKTDSNGVVPKRDDWRTAIGLGIEL